MDKVKEGQILIEHQPDGNYKGWTIKFGKEIEAREAKPEDVLASLLTHGG